MEMWKKGGVHFESEKTILGNKMRKGGLENWVFTGHFEIQRNRKITTKLPCPIV